MSASSPSSEAPIHVVALSIRDLAGRFLTVRKRGTVAFMQPGGKPEPGESPEQTAVREIAEELGAQVCDLAPLGEWTAAAANEAGRDVHGIVFSARLASMTGPQAEIEEVRWLDPADWGMTDELVAPLLRDHVASAVAPLPPVVVVGIGADGALAAGGAAALAEADVVLGGARHLDLLPPAPAGQERRGWPSPLAAGLPALLEEYADRRLVALASGDPMLSGVGSTLARLVGRRLRVLPAVSSVALARARMGWSAEETEVITLVGRDPAVLRRELAPGRRVLVLSADETTPAVVAELVTDAGSGPSRMSVLGDLGSPRESRVDAQAADATLWAAALPRLNIVALELTGRGHSSWAAGRSEDEFSHDGQITKRDVRASALARLQPAPGQLLWDVGAGAGSVGIEWLRAHPGCRAIAVEGSAERIERIRANASAFGVPGLEVVHGRAPAALAGLADPDAVFVGGGATADGLLELCVERLRPGGRLVGHGVTVETEQVLLAAYSRWGGELTRISVERAERLGGFTGFKPARAVTQWCWSKPYSEEGR